MLDELRQIAIFAKTVDHGSFRAAARALNLSPSVVSHHVGQLEQRLNTALLYRSTRKLALTPEGERLLVAAHDMINAAEAGLQDIVNYTGQPSGMLRFTAPAFLTQSSLTNQIAKFSIAYPEVEVAINFSDTRKNLIADGFDIAIRAGEMEDSALIAKKLFSLERKLVAAPDYLNAQAIKPTAPGDLNELDWLLLDPVKRQKLVFHKAGKEILIAQPDSRIVVNDAYALSQLAQAGAGLAVVPEFVAAPLVSSGSLLYVLPDWTLKSIDVFAVWPSNAPKYGLVKHFINFIADQYKTTKQ